MAYDASDNVLIGFSCFISTCEGREHNYVHHRVTINGAVKMTIKGFKQKRVQKTNRPIKQQEIIEKCKS